MFGAFNFERRRNKALALFTRAIDQMQELVEQSNERSAKLAMRASVLMNEANILSTDAGKAKITLDKLKQLVV